MRIIPHSPLGFGNPHFVEHFGGALLGFDPADVLMQADGFDDLRRR